MGRQGWALFLLVGCSAGPVAGSATDGGSSGTDGAVATTTTTAVDSTTGSPTSEGTAGSGDGSSSGEGSSGGVICDDTLRRDVLYAQTDAEEELNSLDVWPRQGEIDQPILVFVHGGGWVSGDKATHEEIPSFGSFFADAGFALVPVNYRLVDDPRSPGTTYAEQAEDVASAIAWVSSHAREFCGDPQRIQLVGHSAGAHLVALVATDPRYLAAHGMQPSDLAGVVALDVNAYDIEWSIENGADHGYPAAAVNLPQVFGPNVSTWRDASPITFIGDEPLPRQLVVSAPVQTGGIVQDLSRAASELYVDALNTAGHPAEFFEAAAHTHSSLVTQLGTGDPYNQRLRDFLDEG